MKFDGFNLDLTKVKNGYGINPLDDGLEEDLGPSSSGGSTSDTSEIWNDLWSHIWGCFDRSKAC